MPGHRVVITGMGAVSPFGFGTKTLWDALLQGQSGIRLVPGLKKIKGLRCHIGGKVEEPDAGQIPRKYRRSMSAMSIYSVLAATEAIEQAGIGKELLQSGRAGVSIGSTVGSPHSYESFFTEYLKEYSIEQLKSTLFFKIMGHTCASNVAQTMGITGRILAPSSACATSGQAIGYGFEMIRAGEQDIMICGGAEELHPLTVATFDIINAASTEFNDRPKDTPRPFDRDRDGTVCSEGAGIFVMESLESARRRGADMFAEIAGFSTVTDTSNISNPDPASVKRCMESVLENADLHPRDIDYINAHATATHLGDVAECEAIRELFGDRVPVSSLKGHLGHSLAASGVLELIVVIDMMQTGILLPTLNLEMVDPACENIYHLQRQEKYKTRVAIKNNFALGGVNASLVLRSFGNE